MLKHAFKEWAVICRALAEGRQAIILRKGGIAEAGGSFQVEHSRFWLFPTYVHQQRGGIRPEAVPLLELAESTKPPQGMIRLTHFADVPRVYGVSDLETASSLQDLHCWSEQTIRGRFAYREPGLFVLAVRVYRVAKSFELPDTAHYAGCKSWVELEEGLPVEGKTPVLDDRAFQRVLDRLDVLIEQ